MKKSTKVRPLRTKTMTLEKLQKETLKVIRRMRFQLGREGYETGMSDLEFIQEVLDPLETRIRQDIEILKQ